MKKIPLSSIEKQEFVDIPSSVPEIQIPLQRVGISKRPHYVAVLDPFAGKPTRLLCDIKTSLDLPAKQRGLHMSRIEGALQAMDLEKPKSLKDYVVKLCQNTKKLQKQKNCRIELSADYELLVKKNASGKPSHEVIKLYMAAEQIGARMNVELGMTVPFVNACPCTQRWALKEFNSKLKQKGFKPAEVEFLLQNAPLQAHTNSGEATLVVHSSKIDFKKLYSLLERSVILIRERLSGEDEHFVVRDVHQQGMFCEDGIRSVLANAATIKADPKTLIEVHVEVNESVHFHNLFGSHVDTLQNLKRSISS